MYISDVYVHLSICISFHRSSAVLLTMALQSVLKSVSKSRFNSVLSQKLFWLTSSFHTTSEYAIYKDSVLVCSGCGNRVPQTDWFINKRNLFPTVVEGRKFKIKVPADLVSDKVCFLVRQAVFLLSLHSVNGARLLSRVFYKNSNPIHLTLLLPHDPITFQRLHSKYHHFRDQVSA